MSLKKLPKINAKDQHGVKWDTPSDAMSKWDASLVSAGSDDSTITMYDAIGSDGWHDGVTAKRVAAALRSIGSKDVTVSINSPGGDCAEGIAIYNLLRDHPRSVTVKIVGIAASAASIIAMAGDEIQISKAGAIMIHKAWGVTVGNDDDHESSIDILRGFDSAMASIYSAATGIPEDKVVASMVGEKKNGTWMWGTGAIDAGFATSLLPSDEILDAGKDEKSNAALKKVELALARQGLPRSERRELLREITGGTPGAASTVMPGAGDITNEIDKSVKILQGIYK